MRESTQIGFIFKCLLFQYYSWGEKCIEMGLVFQYGKPVVTV